MEWSNLLSSRRLESDKSETYDPARPPWQMDYDRIVFSSAFRRMQDKTQVFPLSGSDFVRTRLTHSLEVSTVARTIGTMAGKIILDRHGKEPYCQEGKTLGQVLSPADIGTITSTGALAHDIGNPPFGHSGENAIRYWFNNSTIAKDIGGKLNPEQRAEFKNWEGNAAGFRILARQQMVRNKGGLRLTAASLGAYAKYPTAATAVATKAEADAGNQAAKKPGFFLHDRELWVQVAEELGLIKDPDRDRWCRHPLAYLTEAADDICYRIIDLEDGFRLGRIAYQELEPLFVSVLGAGGAGKLAKIPQNDELDRVTYLRSMIFGVVVGQLVEAFAEHEASMLGGMFSGDLIEKVPSYPELKAMKKLAAQRAYSTPSVLEIEAAGFEIIPGLLDAYAGAVESAAQDTAEPCPKSQKLLNLMPSEFLADERKPDPDLYVRLLGVVDFVAGMTDSFALTRYRRIKGVSLPS